MAAHGKQVRPLISRLSLLLFVLCSSVSYVVAAGVGGNGDALAQDEPVRWRKVEIRADETRPQPAHVARDCTVTITPAPDLLRRQDQGQIQALSAQLQQVSEQSRSVSRASQQVSQESQQLSQSLQQASQRLSETERQLATVRISLDAAQQASRSLSQAAAEASRRVDEARQSADRAVQQAIRSVSEAMVQSMASQSRSFQNALVQASQTAASLVQKAQAEATAVRSEASDQVQQAQGAALSVTQTALAVVGGIIGSSLLTILAFVLILRYRRKRRLSRMGGRTPPISYPDLKGSSDNTVGGGRIGGYAASDAESTYSTDTNGFRRDIKEPAAVAVRGSVNIGAPGGPNGRGTPGVGYALSYYGPQPGSQEKNNNSNNAMSGTTAGNNNSSGFHLSDPPKGKFTLFPRNNSKDDLASPQSGISTTMTSSSGGSGRATPQMTLKRTSKGFAPSLDTWIRAGTVSPFATMKKSAPDTKR